MSDIELLSGASPAVWATLRELELAADTQIGDVDFDGNYGPLKVIGWLWCEDAYQAMHRIAAHLGIEVTVKGPYNGDGSPSGGTVAMSVPVPLEEAVLQVKALIDAVVYAKAAEAREGVGVPA